MEVHVFDGFMAAGPRHRAVCTCGHVTDPPAATRSQAAEELPKQHELSPLVCARCGEPRPAVNHYGAPRHLVLTLGPGAQCRLECAGHHAAPASAADEAGPAGAGPGSIDGPVLYLT